MPKLKKVECDICGQRCDPRGLGVHRRHNHPEAGPLPNYLRAKKANTRAKKAAAPKGGLFKAQPCTCRECGESFPSLNQLSRHKTQVHPSQARTRLKAAAAAQNGHAPQPPVKKPAPTPPRALPVLLRCPVCACNLEAVAIAAASF